jgi:hypothetical protein
MFAVSLGCFHDDVRAEPGSWMVGPKAPNGPATRRAEDGPNGAARRRIPLTHQCLSAILEGWNALTEDNKIIQWADGIWRRTLILLAGIFMDQPETDTYCCDTAQSCSSANAQSTSCMSRSITPRNTHILCRQRSCGQRTVSILGRKGSFTAMAVSGRLLPIAAKRHTSVVGRL